MSIVLPPAPKNLEERNAREWLLFTPGGYKRVMEDRKRRVREELAKHAAEEQSVERRRSEGVGDLVASISLEDWMLWQQTLRGCWSDKGFIKKYIKKNEYCRVQKPKQRVFQGGIVTA